MAEARYLTVGGAHKLRRTQGFTLIEVLVVLLIMGIVVGFAALSMSGQTVDEEMQTEARRLQKLMAFASETAVLKGVQLGLVLSGDHYRFVEYEIHTWTIFSHAGPLRPRRVAQPLQLDLTANGLDLPSHGPEALGGPADRPSVLFLSSGEVTPFTLTVRAQGLAPYYRISLGNMGKIRLKRVTPGHD